MSTDIENIVFEDCDTATTIATKTTLIHAGSSQLKTELKKLNIDYVKVIKGLNTYYVLTGKEIGKLSIKL